MRQLAFAAGQAAADLAQRMRAPELREQHRDELVPAGKAPRVPLGLGGMHGALEVGPWK